MKISFEWIKDYVDLPEGLSVQKLMHDLTMATVEVEGAEEPGKGLESIVVGTVEKLEPAPNRASTQLAYCTTGTHGLKKILCGADNVKAGMRVAIALPGARIRPYGEESEIVVQAIEVGGVTSEAVICAASEIGLEILFPTENRRAIIDLESVPVANGTALADVIGWNDIVFEIDNKSLTNRPDLWGHYGMARELAAIYNRPLKPLCPPTKRPPAASTRRLVGEIDAKHCRRFTALSVKNVEHSPAPFWMQSRLARIGQRPINFYADVTNYIMFAVGQPCHAYDTARVQLPLGVRPGKKGETVKLLDGFEYELEPNVLAISDASGAIAVAGVMGGDSSGISPETREVLLEAANFDPVMVRRGAKRLGLRTDASSRFEKGIDTQRIDGALDLFVTIVREAQPGAEISTFEDVLVRPTEQVKIAVDLPFLRARLGKDVTATEVERSLRSIGFEVERTGEQFTVLPPTWRSTGDISQRFDLIEEVARLHGYDDFQFTSARVDLQGRVKNPRLSLERRAREVLAFAAGMQEIVTYPWVKDRYLEAAGFTIEQCLKLGGAPAPDQSCLQPSLVPNLLEAIGLNLRYFPAFRIFEVGTIFPEKSLAPLSDPREKLPVQRKHIAGALVGSDTETLFREAKGILEQLRRSAHTASFAYTTETTAPWADRSGRLGIEANGHFAGTIGVLSNRAKRLSGIRRGEIVLFELNLDLLEPLPSRDNKYRPVPEFPAVDFDLSLLFANETSWEKIAGTAAAAHNLIQEVLFVDQYRGSDIPQGKKSVTLRLRLSSSERTLKSEEAGEVSAMVTDRLKRACGAEQRV